MNAESLWMSRLEDDPGFQDSIQRAGYLSLRTVGWLEVLVPLLMLSAGLSILPVPVEQSGWIPNMIFVGLGTVTVLAATTPLGRKWPRLVGGISVIISVGAIVWTALLLASEIYWVEHHLLGYITLVMFAAAASLPYKPAHMLALGLSFSAVYLGSVLIAQQRLAFESTWVGIRQHVFVLVVTALCTLLTASVYRQRWSSYQAHQRALQASEDLRETQCRLLLSENAAVLGRVGAALSHELNSPIGVLTSAVDTLATLARRIDTADPADRERLHTLLDDVHRSGRQSAARLRDIVTRMQRFANLDRADIQSANLNSLLTDVVALVGSEQGRTSSIEARFGNIPHFVCRPQQLSAVFSNLVGNALDATHPNGHVSVITERADSWIEIRIEDNGKGIPEKDFAHLFDPGAFRESEGRMKAGYSGLFSCRQIVREHAGDLDIRTSPAGTTVRVLLPIAEVSTASTTHRV